MVNEFDRTVTVNDSTNILLLQYSTVSRTLRVFFKSGSIYDYLKVTKQDFAKLVASDSIGEAFNNLIKGSYGYMKL